MDKSFRRKPAFTKSELKTCAAAADEAGLEAWTIEREAPDGTVTRFISGPSTGLDNVTEWDRHDAR